MNSKLILKEKYIDQIQIDNIIRIIKKQYFNNQNLLLWWIAPFDPIASAELVKKYSIIDLSDHDHDDIEAILSVRKQLKGKWTREECIKEGGCCYQCKGLIKFRDTGVTRVRLRENLRDSELWDSFE